MAESKGSFSRREFLGTTLASTAAVAAAGLAKPLAAFAAPPDKKHRIALIGTGSRGTSMWGRQLLQGHGDYVEFVGLCDPNKIRLENSKQMIGTDAPTFTDFDEMITKTKPEMLIVTTVDATHWQYITRGMEHGVDIITEKPMATDEKQCQAIIDTQKRTGRNIIVTFNYRYGSVHEKTREVLMSGEIGQILSADFHWFLDTTHGADYFRRWHAYKRNSGSLLVHKATHHFDLMNFWLDAEPVEVFAYGELDVYGKNGTFRGPKCRGCPHRDQCNFYWDVTKNSAYVKLYVEAEGEDGYFRDGCVYREDIDIYDTMAVQVKYNTGVHMSYSLNACMPYEGAQVAFNGTKGRLDVRFYERQPWDEPNLGVLRISRNFGTSEVINVPPAKGGHGGGDPKLKSMIFDASIPDPLGQRAGLRQGAMSILTGIAGRHSIEEKRPIKIADLVTF